MLMMPRLEVRGEGSRLILLLLGLGRLEVRMVRGLAADAHDARPWGRLEVRGRAADAHDARPWGRLEVRWRAADAHDARP